MLQRVLAMLFFTDFASDVCRTEHLCLQCVQSEVAEVTNEKG